MAMSRKLLYRQVLRSSTHVLYSDTVAHQSLCGVEKCCSFGSALTGFSIVSQDMSRLTACFI